MTVSPSAGRVATMPPSPLESSVVSEARGQPGGDVSRDHAGAEEDRVGLVGVRLDGVHDRLGQSAGEGRIVGHQHPRRAVAAERGRPVVVDARSGDERRHVAAQTRDLGQNAEAVGGELAVVVMNVDEH
jgi:hypothetical protein